jgi:hypothetical protein
MFTVDAGHLPLIAALATLAAAIVAATAALTVAFVNAWAQRRLERDKAHRAYRADQAAPYIKRANEMHRLGKQLLEAVSNLEATSNS